MRWRKRRKNVCTCTRKSTRKLQNMKSIALNAICRSVAQELRGHSTCNYMHQIKRVSRMSGAWQSRNGGAYPLITIYNRYGHSVAVAAAQGADASTGLARLGSDASCQMCREIPRLTMLMWVVFDRGTCVAYDSGVLLHSLGYGQRRWSI